MVCENDTAFQRDFPAGLDKEEEEEEEENTTMTETVELSAGQKRFREAVAKFALPGETWLTNAMARPYYKSQSYEEVVKKIEEEYPNHDIRVDGDHIVDGFGNIFTSSGFNQAHHDDERQINFAVYGKPKPPMP